MILKAKDSCISKAAKFGDFKSRQYYLERCKGWHSEGIIS
jgi:hypothetical protein